MSREFTKVATVQDLDGKDRMVVKIRNKQILLVKSEDGILACNNRCPHEGYPLSEGSLSKDCTLTCNWHNWKFNLKSGATLVGGDQVRTYDVQISGSDIFLDLTAPPKEQQIAKALQNLKASLKRQEYDRVAREISRLEKVGGDPLEAVRQTILWTHDRYEYGMTHAFAVIPDWLALRNVTSASAADRLVTLVESVGHMSWDSLREPSYPFTDKVTPFQADDFEDAIEQEDEERAIAQLNGGLKSGVDTKTLFTSLARGALRHYADFGHSAIYTYKAKQLIERLGPSVRAPVLKALIRNLIYARREDLLPEFRPYSPALSNWDKDRPASDTELSIEGSGIKEALSRTTANSGVDPEIIYARLLKQLARNMLHFDMTTMERWDNSVSRNISWLDFSHGLTFGNAIRNICRENPELWPQALLQMACFSARNSSFIDFKQNTKKWHVSDVEGFLKEQKQKLFDHGNPEFIVSAHLVKVVSAVAEEVQHNPEGLYVADLIAAMNRLLNSPFKRKHTRRVANQSIDFVAREG